MDSITAKYRHTFSSFDGEVLEDIIFNICKFGEPFSADDKVRVAGFNLAMAILERMGIMTHGTHHDVIRALLSVAPITHTEE